MGRWSVRPLVRNAFVKIAENGVMQDGDASYVVYTCLKVENGHMDTSDLLYLRVLVPIASRTHGMTDQRTHGRTHPLIEM